MASIRSELKLRTNNILIWKFSSIVGPPEHTSHKIVDMLVPCTACTMF